MRPVRIRVFAVALVDAAPVRIAADVDHRGAVDQALLLALEIRVLMPAVVDRAGLVGDGRGDFVNQLRVPRGGHGDGDREHRRRLGPTRRRAGTGSTCPSGCRSARTSGPLWLSSVAFSSSVRREIRSRTRLSTGRFGSRHAPASDAAPATTTVDQHATPIITQRTMPVTRFERPLNPMYTPSQGDCLRPQA